ncbi:MAG: aspartyl protease family protein [Planctomycetota bacterium]|nr:aspartyl protease family protein [Planctomycetota bacterium]
MGEIKVSVFLQNAGDLILAEDGRQARNKVRARKIEALVDTGAVMTLLPQDLVEYLGLKVSGKAIVTLADDTKKEMPVAEIVAMTVCERTWVTDCIVGPPGCEPLLGRLVLERLDLVPDPLNGVLAPRPESPFLPSLKLKKTDEEKPRPRKRSSSARGAAKEAGRKQPAILKDTAGLPAGQPDDGSRNDG